MKKTIIAKAAALIMSSALFLSSLPFSASAESINMTNAVKSLESGVTISADQISTDNYKDTRFNNPISPDFFCADPTAVEYNGRLYVYGTNDHQQFEAAGPDVDNTYEKIKSLLVFSTEDMVNWTYHGEINVGKIAPWISASWAPSIVSREESDGKTHFYLYFSNSGVGTGVITSTDPVTGWTDPLGHCLVTSSTPGLSDCPNPFDPGAVIDENGVGWLSFGAGTASNGTDYMPGSVRIVRLGDDMISFDSDFKQIPAPYSFEASELNYINGTYVYTYCSDWNNHSEKWDFDCPAPGGCGMVYMTTKTPLDPTSWKMMGECFRQPGEVGFDYSNNHTHMHKFKDKWYMFYHTLMLKHGMGITGGYRSMGVDEIEVDEKNVVIKDIGGTKKGASQNGTFSPYVEHSAAELVGTAQIDYDMTDPYAPIVSAKQSGSWTAVRGVQFTESENSSQPAVSELVKMNIDTIQFNLTVTSVESPTTITMYASAQNGVKNENSVEVTGKGKYKVTVDMNGAKGFQIVGCFIAANDTPVTLEVDSITLNGKYNIAVASELTNTREWADGLRNIWNGFSDGDAVYTDDYAVLKYVKADDAIELFASENAGSSDNAPLVENPLAFVSSVKGKGSIEVHLDEPAGELLTRIVFDSPNGFTNVYSDSISNIGGTHDLYFVYSDKGVSMQSWKFAESDEASDRLMGDVNADGKFNISDAVMLQKWILAVPDVKLSDWKAADLCEDGVINVFDLCVMKQKLISREVTSNEVYVENTDELKNALKNAKAGDEIILAEGEYVYSGDTPKGYMFTSSADGTEANPIIIRSENPEKPAILSGSSTSENYVLDISGDWWEIKDLKVTNAQKGIILDNSNHTEIINCEVYNIGSEGIHFRDNSSYCLAENCYVHDTGVVSPGYGEAVYVGSAKSTSGYGHDCHYNTIRNCKLGPNVAAEHVDIKEYTIGTTVENCTFDGTGMSGENFAKSFVNIKGNDCVIRNNVGYRNGCTAIQRAFEQNNVVDGWGQNATVYGNKVYMDTATNALGKKMYFLNAWDCSATVWDNFMAYEGELFSVDNEDDHWKYYNCNLLTYESK